MDKKLKRKKVILSVTNDLSNDQRVHKVATSLLTMGFTPILVGYRLRKTEKLTKRDYSFYRFFLPFSKSWLFFACYNLRLFLFLIFSKTDILVSNDLDTLLANYSAYKLKKILGNRNMRLIYDSHELYTEIPELVNRKFVKSVWLYIERKILPKIKSAYTVCSPIADYYKNKYGIDMHIVKNLPFSEKKGSLKMYNFKIPKGKKIILYQGALNVGRGIEQIINVIHYFENTIFLVVGKGQIEQNLWNLVAEKKLEKKVLFTGSVPFEQLRAITLQADVGLVLQEKNCLNYTYALPNRLFDFINAGIPMLAINSDEIREVIEKEKIGLLVDGFRESELIENINILLNDNKLVDVFKTNLKKCKNKYTWEGQESILELIYKS